MAYHVIYLPGVNDQKNAPIQIKALGKWRKFSLEPHFEYLGWNQSEPYQEKLNKILKMVDSLTATGQAISIIGVSAGASLAVNLFTERKDKITAVVLICGKINNPQTLGDNYKKQNPALLDCVSASDQNAKALQPQDKQKMLTIRPLFDGTVAKSDSVIAGVKNQNILSLLHAPSIYLALTLYKRFTINFLKSQELK